MSHSFIFRTQIKIQYFWWNSQLPWFKAQKVSKDIIKIVHVSWYSREHVLKTENRNNCWIKLLFLFSLHTKIFSYLHNITVEPLMSHGLFYRCDTFLTLNMVVMLLPMESQKALGYHQKYLHLCFEDERRSYMFGTTWEWVINDRIFIFGWTNPLMSAFCEPFDLPEPLEWNDSDF